VQACADSSNFDVERVGDAPVIQIAVVPKKENESLSIWECGQDGGDVVSVGPFSRILRQIWQIGDRYLSLVTSCACCVDDASPHPVLESALTAVVATVLDGTRERVVHSVSGLVDVTGDRLSDPKKTMKSSLVEVGEVR
jgi:hypothetical protein